MDCELGQLAKLARGSCSPPFEAGRPLLVGLAGETLALLPAANRPRGRRRLSSSFVRRAAAGSDENGPLSRQSGPPMRRGPPRRERGDLRSCTASAFSGRPAPSREGRPASAGPADPLAWTPLGHDTAAWSGGLSVRSVTSREVAADDEARSHQAQRDGEDDARSHVQTGFDEGPFLCGARHGGQGDRSADDR